MEGNRKYATDLAAYNVAVAKVTADSASPAVAK
jgi:hypothetical protein